MVLIYHSVLTPAISIHNAYVTMYIHAAHVHVHVRVHGYKEGLMKCDSGRMCSHFKGAQ